MLYVNLCFYSGYSLFYFSYKLSNFDEVRHLFGEDLEYYRYTYWLDSGIVITVCATTNTVVHLIVSFWIPGSEMFHFDGLDGWSTPEQVRAHLGTPDSIIDEMINFEVQLRAYGYYRDDRLAWSWLNFSPCEEDGVTRRLNSVVISDTWWRQ